MIRRLPLLVGGMVLGMGLWACDSLSDPSKTNPEGPVGRVSGALVGTVPSNTRVAIVWLTERGLGRGSDVAVVDGHFSMDLGDVPAEYLDVVERDDNSAPSGGSGPSPYPSTDSPVAVDAGVATQSLHTRANASGTTIGSLLRLGQAGFIVYVDKNGNQQLDFDDNATATDTLIGGNRELVLTYLQNGTTYDYEKLRDNTGQLPVEGYNLAWSGGNNGTRWFPLTDIQLNLDEPEASLPADVCNNFVKYANNDQVYVDAGTSACNPYGCVQPVANNLCLASFDVVGTCATDCTNGYNPGADASAPWPSAVDAGPSRGLDSGVDHTVDAGIEK